MICHKRCFASGLVRLFKNSGVSRVQWCHLSSVTWSENQKQHLSAVLVWLHWTWLGLALKPTHMISSILKLLWHFDMPGCTTVILWQWEHCEETFSSSVFLVKYQAKCSDIKFCFPKKTVYAQNKNKYLPEG